MASAPLYRNRWPTYASWWDRAEVRAARAHEVALTAKKLLANKPRYVGIEKKTGVPWFLIAVLHERESGARFDRQLAQGDPLNRRSTNEPISGPFPTFEASAVWALQHDHLTGVIDWRIEKVLYWAEGWNGWGYYLYHPQTPSPYVVGATTIQKPGKYVRDGVWSSTAMDGQIGVLALIKALVDLDPTIKVTRETKDDSPAPAPVPANRPVVPAKQVTVGPVAPDAPAVKEAAPKPGMLSAIWGWLNKTR